MSGRDDQLPANVFVNTAASVALVRTSESKYQDARSLLTQFAKARARFHTSNFVVAESHAFLLSKSGRDVAANFLNTIEKAIFYSVLPSTATLDSMVSLRPLTLYRNARLRSPSVSSCRRCRGLPAG